MEPPHNRDEAPRAGWIKTENIPYNNKRNMGPCCCCCRFTITPQTGTVSSNVPAPVGYLLFLLAQQRRQYVVTKETRPT